MDLLAQLFPYLSSAIASGVVALFGWLLRRFVGSTLKQIEKLVAQVQEHSERLALGTQSFYDLKDQVKELRKQLAKLEGVRERLEDAERRLDRLEDFENDR